MKVKRVKVSQLRPAEHNCRRHAPRQVAELVRSLKAFGQTRPFVIDESNVVLVGNGMLAAMQSAGIEEADAYVVSGWSEAQKRKLMLADNKCYELGSSDIDEIFASLKTLGAEGDFDVPGFEEDSIRRLCDSVCEEAFRTTKLSTYDAPMTESARAYEKETGITIPPTGVEGPVVPDRVAEETSPSPVIVRPTAGPDYIICPHCGGHIPRN